MTPGRVFPGWNVGNPLRMGWNGTRGLSKRISFTNRYGALLNGTVYRPKPGARDPYTGQMLRGPFPGVVITEGSVQGSEGMYRWLAQDLAERGYVVLTYDVQGQGGGETLPHEPVPGGESNALPFCNPFAAPQDGEQFGCPGVPSQQLSNFVVGTKDALSFFTSTPSRHYANPRSEGAKVSAYNPYWQQFDRAADQRTATPGRTSKIAIIGHSMGAAAVSKVQGTDRARGRSGGPRQARRPGCIRSARRKRQQAGRSGARPAVGVRLHRLAVPHQRWLLAHPAAHSRGPGPEARARHRVRRLAQGRRRQHARRPAGLHAPGVHRHPARAARQPLRPGPLQPLRAGLARPLPEAPAQRLRPDRHAASSTSNPPATACGSR